MRLHLHTQLTPLYYQNHPSLMQTLMVGSTIPYSPFERAVTRPKLNAMQYCYGVGSNFITGAPPEFEDLITLRLCMKPKYNDPNCTISKWGFTRSDLSDLIRNETSIRMRLTKQ